MGVNRIEIEELVLQDFGRSDGAAIELALRSGLAGAGRRFGEPRTIARIDPTAIELSAGASHRAIGGAVAERLHGSVQT
jgi:hypothetical protein